MSAAVTALRVFVYALVGEYVCRGVALAASPSWGYRLAGYALTLAAIVLAAQRGASLASGDFGERVQLRKAMRLRETLREGER